MLKVQFNSMRYELHFEHLTLKGKYPRYGKKQMVGGFMAKKTLTEANWKIGDPMINENDFWQDPN